jgi:hypothetical protein
LDIGACLLRLKYKREPTMEPLDSANVPRRLCVTKVPGCGKSDPADYSFAVVTAMWAAGIWVAVVVVAIIKDYL